MVDAGLNRSVRSETAAAAAVKTGYDFAVGLIQIPGSFNTPAFQILRCAQDDRVMIISGRV